jgi:hypothetical protein
MEQLDAQIQTLEEIFFEDYDDEPIPANILGYIRELLLENPKSYNKYTLLNWYLMRTKFYNCKRIDAVYRRGGLWTNKNSSK